MDGQALDLVQIGPVIFRSQYDNLAFPDAFVKIHLFDIAEIVQYLNAVIDAVRHGAGDLAAVLPVDLVAVVILGIMGSGDVDAGNGAQAPDQVGQLGGRPQIREDIGFDPVGRQNARGQLAESLGEMPAVMGDDDALCGRFGALLQDIIRQSLGGSADHVGIHAVGAGLELSPQTGGAEGQLLVKAFFDLVLVVINGEQFLIERALLIHAFDPSMVALFCVHRYSPPMIVGWRPRVRTAAGRTCSGFLLPFYHSYPPSARKVVKNCIYFVRRTHQIYKKLTKL